MKIEIEQSSLSALLSRVQNAVEKRNNIPVLSNVLLSAFADTLQAVATDMDVEVTTTAQASVMSTGACTVSASTLAAIVTKLGKGKIVTLESKDNILTISSGRSSISLAELPVEDFPRIASSEYEAIFQSDQDQVKRLLDLSAFAMSTEETKYYLGGIYLHPIDGFARAVSTDGHRLAKIDSKIEAEFPGVIIPRKTVNLVKALIDDDGLVSVSVSQTKIKFDFSHTVVVSKVIDGVFPDYTRIMPKDHQTEVIVSANDVKQASALVSLVSGEKVRAVKVSAKDGILTLTVRAGTEIGVEDVDAELIGEPVELGVNSKYLADILSACNGDNAVLRFQTSGDPIVIQPQEDDQAMFLCMPMRI